MERPIFIIGTGRCGSTALHRVLSRHPNVAWLSWLCQKHPARPWLNRWLMRALDLPLPGRVRRRLNPAECYGFWDHYYRGFSRPCRDLEAGDATIVVKRALQQVMAQMVTPRRHRLLLKVTGWPRIGFLHEVFPDARFVHIVRDGRAVAHSLTQISWWHGWRGPGNWRTGELDPTMQQEWERHGRSFLALAALQWKILLAATEKAAAALDPGDFFEIGYEQLCADPVGVCRAVAGFAGLEWTKGFERTVRRYPFSSANDKWRRDLTPAQQQILDSIVGDYRP